MRWVPSPIPAPPPLIQSPPPQEPDLKTTLRVNSAGQQPFFLHSFLFLITTPQTEHNHNKQPLWFSKNMDSSSSSSSSSMKSPVCVLDASTYVGFWVLKGLLTRGYLVHAALQKKGERAIVERIREEERKMKKRLVVFEVDVLEYGSVLAALKGCCAMVCSLDSPGVEDERMVDMEVRGAINVVEACAQTSGLRRMVFSSSLTAAIWRDNICMQKDVDERSWSDHDFCRKMKLWYALTKTLSEKAAWALAMDRMLDMVSINGGLVIGPGVTQENHQLTISYLKGAAEMYENGVLAFVDVDFLADVHIRALEDESSRGRYFCYNHVVRTEEEATKLVKCLSPLISLPPRYKNEEKEVQVGGRLRTRKLDQLVEAIAY